ncbi:MAG: ATP-binding protein [Polyangia bacterium]|jgi:hypothetical protein|nr:ATP-binding protein [Polyangia bacterium]
MAVTDTHDALDNLVNQFSDPMSFFRELIQNALDAGTPEIEVDFEYEPGKGSQAGVMIVHVNDFGAGMDREIIDTKLTRLFSSSKDGDFTKIGRFGIGFVSVFAINPDAVCVDTSRGGETWRVLFKRDRTFVRIALDKPVDGTKIRILKTSTPEEYDAFIARAREVVSYWCRHTRTEILFQGEPVNQPFGLDLPCTASHEEEGTRVVVGYRAEPAGWFGFYNKGLTLHEGSGEFWPHVAFKVDSRYLEHTLTRDNVLRDDNFAKALGIVKRLVTTELPKRLLAALEKRRESPKDRDAPLLHSALARVAREQPKVLQQEGARAIFRSISGDPVTLEALLRASRKKRLYVEDMPSLVTEAILADGGVVLQMDSQETKQFKSGRKVSSATAYQALEAILGQEPRWASQLFCRPRLAPEGEVPEWPRLQRALMALLDGWGARLSGVSLAHFADLGSSIGDLVAITQEEPGCLSQVEEVRRLGTTFLSRSRALVTNADHRIVKACLGLADKEPELAAYALAKLFLLGDKLTTVVDGELATISLEGRRLRAAAGAR